MSTRTGLPADPAADVIERWHAGDRFGVLCTGDAVFAETVFRSLAPTAERSFGHAERVGPEDLAGFDGERVVALAWDLADVHPALLRRCTAVLHGNTLGTSRAPMPRSAEDLTAAIVRLLESAGVRDHGIELASARLALGLRAGGCRDPLGVVRTVVADPRRSTVPGSGENDEFGESGEATPQGDRIPVGEAEGQQGPAPEPIPESAPPDDDDDPTVAGDGADGGAAAPNSDADELPANESDAAPGDAGAVGDVIDDSPDGTADGPGVGTDGASLPFDVPMAADATPAGRCGSTVGPDEQEEGSAITRSGDGEQGLGQLGERSDADVQQALRTTRSLRIRDAKAHLRGSRGARSRSAEHGAIARVVPPERVGGRIAVVPTVHRAARRRASSVDADSDAVVIRDDLRGALRRRRGGHHTVIVVDGSSSLGRSGLLRAGAAADQAVASIAARRGVVSVIVAAGQRARVVVERSTSLARTRQAVESARTGGGTPLTHALALAVELLLNDESARRRMLLMTDGQPTVGLGGSHLSPVAATDELARMLAEAISCTPDVTWLPVGSPAGRNRAPFIAAGVRILGGQTRGG